MDWFRDLVRSDTGIFWLAISIIATLPVLIWGVVEIVQASHRHRERLEMIRHGMHPDTPYPGKKRDEEAGRASADAVTSS